jgi:hypothetical protein
MSWVRIPPNPQRYRCFLVGPTIIKVRKERVLPETKSDPWVLYVYAMKSPATKEKYLLRLGKFLDFTGLQGSLEDKARNFAERGTKDTFWAFNNILSFMQSLKDRADRKEITAGTIRNYVKSIKLFCQMG